MPFFIENITVNPITVGGWYDDYNKDSAKVLTKLLPGDRLELDEGALNNPVVRDLQRRSIIRIFNVDFIPLKSQDDNWEDLKVNSTLSLEERVTLLEAGGAGTGLDVIISGTAPTPTEIPNMYTKIWVDTGSGCKFVAFRYLGVLYTVEMSPH